MTLSTTLNNDQSIAIRLELALFQKYHRWINCYNNEDDKKAVDKLRK
jgi:maltoporin